MDTRTVEKPSALLLATLVLGGIAFGIQNMARTAVPRAWSIAEPAAETQPASVQPQSLDVMMFLHQNTGS
jgi:hypothetical protein